MSVSHMTNSQKPSQIFPLHFNLNTERNKTLLIFAELTTGFMIGKYLEIKRMRNNETC